MSIKGWIGLVVTWFASLFLFFKFGKSSGKKDETIQQYKTRADSVLRGLRACNSSVDNFRRMHNK